MKEEKVLINLCIYDKRNPNSNVEIFGEKSAFGPCTCANCFYGRLKLANELIQIRKLYEMTKSFSFDGICSVDDPGE